MQQLEKFISIQSHLPPIWISCIYNLNINWKQQQNDNKKRPHFNVRQYGQEPKYKISTFKLQIDCVLSEKQKSTLDCSTIPTKFQRYTIWQNVDLDYEHFFTIWTPDPEPGPCIHNLPSSTFISPSSQNFIYNASHYFQSQDLNNPLHINIKLQTIPRKRKKNTEHLITFSKTVVKKVFLNSTNN